MIGYPDFLLKPEAIDKEYEARGGPGPRRGMGTWRGEMVPASASGSAETRMGRCRPKTSHLLLAHCAHHWHGHGHSHTGSAMLSLGSQMMSPSPHRTPQSSTPSSARVGGAPNPAWPRDPTEVLDMQPPTWAHRTGHEDTLVPHLAHGHNPTPSVPKAHGGGRMTQACSPHSWGWHLGLACL